MTPDPGALTPGAPRHIYITAGSSGSGCVPDSFGWLFFCHKTHSECHTISGVGCNDFHKMTTETTPSKDNYFKRCRRSEVLVILYLGDMLSRLAELLLPKVPSHPPTSGATGTKGTPPHPAAFLGFLLWLALTYMQGKLHRTLAISCKEPGECPPVTPGHILPKTQGGRHPGQPA